MRTYLSGFPAINHDTQEIFAEDLRRGESVGAPVAVLVLILMFGTLGGIVIPIAFAAVTIPTTLGFVWVIAHTMDMAIYVTNIVALIGFAIAVDYSMLVVFRYREELARTDDPHAALQTTMATAGRATLFSGLTVAIGLALLVLMPLPFIRSMGVGGLLVPLVSIAASATLLPAMLALMGRGVNRYRVIPRRWLERRARAEDDRVLAPPRDGDHAPPRALLRRLGGADARARGPGARAARHGRRQPRRAPHDRGHARAARARDDPRRRRARAPSDRGRHPPPGRGARTRAVVAAERRLLALLRRDPAIQPRTIAAPVLVTPAVARQANLVDGAGRVLQVRAAGRTDSGTEQAIDLVHRIRERYVPAAGFPGGTDVLLTGAPAFGVDFVAKAYGVFPWLVLAVLVVSYLVLLRAFRSVVLPAKAVVMNLLSVSATYGVLVLVFEHGLGAGAGLGQTPQIDGWIPIFLFALLFGLSMDYEVFLLSRIREEWDRRHDNEQAVAYGLEHTGRIITAAAIIMVAAFAGFVAGSFPALQEFGLGLSVAIILDATVVRAILVPATMKLLGRWNWYLPERVRRALRLRPPQVAREPETAGSR